MAKTRVHELAKTYGIESKEVLEKLKELGEFVKSPSSTIELPVEMKFKKAYGDALLAAQSSAPAAEAPAEAPAAKPGPKKAPAKKAAAAEPEPEVVETPAAAVEAPVEAPARGAPGSRGSGSGRRRVEVAGPRAASGEQARRSASRQQPVRAQPGHGLASRAAAAHRRRGATVTVRRVRRPAVPACRVPTRR